MSECTALSTVGFVPLSRGFTAMVDANDLPRLNGLKWWAKTCKSKTYAVRTVEGRVIPMANELLGFERGPRVVADHANGNPLDNRRANIRAATQGQNNRNQRKTRGTSKFMGVFFDKRINRWRACVAVNRKDYWLGTFADEVDAAKARDRAAIQHHGEFARLNFPHEFTEACRAK
jgi:hypothetical protein